MRQRLWLPNINRNAERDLSELPDNQRPAVLDSIEDLLCSTNPLRASNVRNVKSKPGLWRRRAGRWRVFFELDTTPVKQDGTQYKGTLYVVAVSLRDEATYR